MTKYLSFAEARARKAERGSLIVPERRPAPAFQIGDKALFVDDGRADRVTIASEEWAHPESGEAMRTCHFPGHGEYEVKAANLEPLDVGPAPVALRSGKALGLPAIVTDQGRLYQPDPYRERPRPASIMDKFDRIAAVKPPPAPLDYRTMTEAQADLMRQADEKLASANQRRALRVRKDKNGRIVSHGRVTQAEREERRFAQEAYAQLGLGVVTKRDNDEISTGRAESFALAEARDRAQRREVAKALIRQRVAEAIETWGKLTKERRGAIAKEARELRTAMLDEARSAVLQDVRAGGRRLTRDGLDSLPLNPIELAAALWYRGLYERTERGARVANMEGRVGGETKDRDVKDWGADQIARKQVEARVMSIAKGNGRMITTLRLVAGEGRSIRSLGGGGRNHALYRDALIQALNIVADYRGTQ